MTNWAKPPLRLQDNHTSRTIKQENFEGDVETNGISSPTQQSEKPLLSFVVFCLKI